MTEKDLGKLRPREDADPEKTQETMQPRWPWPHLKAPQVLLPSSKRLFSPAPELAGSGPWDKVPPTPKPGRLTWPSWPVSPAVPEREHFLLTLFGQLQG